MQWHKLLRSLNNKFPDRTVFFYPECSIVADTKDIIIKWFVYVGMPKGGNVKDTIYDEFDKFVDAEKYINKLTDTLTVNQLTKLWGQDGGTELEVP